MNLKSTTRLGLSLFSLAIATAAIQPDRASAATTNLSFTTIQEPLNITVPEAATNSNPIHYLNVASGIDAVVTANVTGANYSFLGHIPSYKTTGTATSSTNDAAFIYQIAANQAGFGVMTYKFDFYQTDGITHNFTTPFTIADFNFLVYDVDGETGTGGRTGIVQTEYLRVAKATGTSGLNSYQIGNSGASSLTATENPNDYLFSGRSINVGETSVNGDVLLNFTNTSSVTLQFETNTLQSIASANQTFSGIDGDSSQTVAGTFSPAVTAKKLPEPFTIIGTILGGTAAFRMRKKLKAASKM